MKNEEYWSRRTQNIFDESYNFQKLSEMYKKSYKELLKDIEQLYEKLENVGTLTRSELYRFERFLTLLEEIEKKNAGIKKELNRETKETLKNAYRKTITDCKEMFGERHPQFTQVNERTLKTFISKDWAGSNFSKRIWKNGDKLAEAVKNDIAECIVRGTSKDEIVKKITGDFETALYRADRLVRTELMHTLNQGKLDAYKERGIAKVKWIAHSKGNRTCDICKEHNGKVYDIDKCPGVLHPNCRCTVVPVWKKSTREFNLDNKKDEKRVGLTKSLGSGKIKLIKPHKVIVGHSGTPKTAEPNNVIDHKNSENKVDIRSFYGMNGYKKKDIHTTDHGNPKQHPFGNHGEHAEDYEWDNEGRLKNKTRRELTAIEREENGEIL